MLSHNKTRRDAFSFSLGGLMAVGGYVGIPAIAPKPQATNAAKTEELSTLPDEGICDSAL